MVASSRRNRFKERPANGLTADRRDCLLFGSDPPAVDNQPLSLRRMAVACEEVTICEAASKQRVRRSGCPSGGPLLLGLPGLQAVQIVGSTLRMLPPTAVGELTMRAGEGKSDIYSPVRNIGYTRRSGA
jgi:hypothetical protein